MHDFQDTFPTVRSQPDEGADRRHPEIVVRGDDPEPPTDPDTSPITAQPGRRKLQPPEATPPAARGGGDGGNGGDEPPEPPRRPPEQKLLSPERRDPTRAEWRQIAGIPERTIGGAAVTHTPEDTPDAPTFPPTDAAETPTDMPSESRRPRWESTAATQTERPSNVSYVDFRRQQRDDPNIASIVTPENHRISAHRLHPDPELVIDAALVASTIYDDYESSGWQERHDITTSHVRTYHEFNDPGFPLFAKVTLQPTNEGQPDSRNGRIELEMYPKAAGAVSSQAVQDAVHVAGFPGGMDVVEPLAVDYDIATGTETVVYPKVEGRRTYEEGVEDYERPTPVPVPGEYEKLGQIAEVVRDKLSEIGVYAPGLSAEQMLVDEGRRTVHLHDLESYRDMLWPGKHIHSDPNGEPVHGPGPRYHDPEMPDISFTPPGVFEGGRAAKDGDPSAGLHIQTEPGDAAVVLWHPQTQQAGLVQIPAAHVGTEDTERYLESAATAMPILVEPGSRAHVIGNHAVWAAVPWIARLVRNLGIADDNVTQVPADENRHIHVAFATGEVQAYRSDRTRAYTNKPPAIPPDTT